MPVRHAKEETEINIEITKTHTYIFLKLVMKIFVI
jgi:hypothetical protein